jgi:uncharacterized protein DUF6308
VLTVAGREIRDPMEIWRSYAARTRTLRDYDLASVGDPGRLTREEAWRTRIISSRISHDECARLLDRANAAPWQCVPVDADLADADPLRGGGLFGEAARLYWYFTTPHEKGFGPAKIHKVLHVKRPTLYPVLDRRIRHLYRTHAVAWVNRISDAQPGDSVTFWAAIREDLVNSENQAELKRYREELRREPRTVQMACLSNLRLLDIIAWETDRRESVVLGAAVRQEHRA